MSSEKNNIEDFLDCALVIYSQEEPRPGFEERVLANLRSAQPRPRWHVRMVYACAAMLLLGAALYGRWWVGLRGSDRASQQTAPRSITKTIPAPVTVGGRPHAKAPERNQEQIVKRVRTAPPRKERLHAAVGSQLPAPRPLSNQEKLLLAFARANPKEVESSIAWQEQMRRPPESAPVSDRGEQ